MSLAFMSELAGGLVVILVATGIFIIRRPKKLKIDRFIASWKELQGFCRDKSTWTLAVTRADKLLEVALKKRKLKGKSMGERMVSAQHIITNNDDMWFAHNLAKKLKTQTDLKLKESEVKKALMGFRQALRDVGALPSSKDEEPNGDKAE